MATVHWILIETQNGWSLARTSSDSVEFHEINALQESNPEEQARQFIETLQQQGHDGQPILMAINSTSCQAAEVAMTDPRQLRQRQARLFELEQYVPLAAEQMVADFVEHSDRLFAVALETDRLEPLIMALEEQGTSVQSLCPAALLALQYHLTKSEMDDPHVVIWGNCDQVDLFYVDESKPVLWRLLPLESLDIVRQLRLLAKDYENQLPLVTQDLPREITERLKRLEGIQLVSNENLELNESAALSSANIISGSCVPWVELRRDGLGMSDPYRSMRGVLRLAVAGLLLFLAGLSASLLIRANAYQHLAIQYHDQQTDEFRKAMSDQPVPAGIESRLKSEYEKRSALYGNDDVLPQDASALGLLHDVLSSLPSQMRFRVLELRISEGRIHLEGEVRSHSDADMIAAKLSQQGFDVEPPHTEKLAGKGVSMRITAEQTEQTHLAQGADR